MTEALPQKRKFWPWHASRLLILLLALVIVATAALWVGRNALALQAVQSWCGGLELTCDGEIVDLGLSSARLEGVAIKNGTATPFAAQTIDVTYSWTGLTKVQIDSVTLDRPVIHAVLEDDGVSLYGLEAAYQTTGTDGESSAQLPILRVNEGKAFLQTAAGEVSAQFQAQGRLIEDGSISIKLTPASLSHEDASLIWTRGQVDLMFLRGAITGQVDIDIEHADLGVMSAENALIQADVTDSNSQLLLKMKGQADKFKHRDRFGIDIVLDLSASAQRPSDGETFDLRGALLTVALDGSAGELSDGTTGARAVEVSALLASVGRGLTGPIAIEAQSVNSPFAEIQHVSISGDFELADEGETEHPPTLTYDGAFVLRDVDASRADLMEPLQPNDLPAAAQPHARQVKRVLMTALSEFDLGASFQFGMKDAQWRLSAAEPTLLQAATGLKLAIAPPPNQPWLEASEQKFALAGLLNLGGGGGPNFQTYLDQVNWRADGLELYLRNGVLQDWDVEGAILHAQYGGLSFEQSAASRFFVDGELALAGTISEIAFERTRLFGKIEGAYGTEGWRVQTVDSKCIGLTMGRLRSGTIMIDPFAMALCPVDGRFVREEVGETVGRINLGDISLPFTTGDSSGTFNFTAAQLDWASGDALKMTVRGQKLDLPMVFGERTMTISSATPTVSAFIGEGAPRIIASLEDTNFTGTMIPANVRTEAFAFDGVAADTGLEGTLRASAVHISDQNDDPLYEPLVSDLEAVLRDGIIDMAGPLRNEKAQTDIADMRLQLHLAELNGSGQVKMRPLTFAPRGLQPTALSEQLRGVLINTNGELSGQADFTILDGKVEGTGNVVLRDVSFDTLKAGTITGANGTIVFSDILGLQSEPNQMFTIDELNLGALLTNGLVAFQLNGPEQASLEFVRWPFAGGTIEVQPTVWSVGGENETIMVELADIELDQLVEILKVPDLLATGTVSGTFPVEFVGANIMVRQAILKADAPGGTLAYTGDATASLEGQNTFIDYGVEALKKFDFSVMQLGVDGNLIGRLLITIDLLGSNENVLGGQPFNFGISVDSDLIPLITSLSNPQITTYYADALELERAELERQRITEQTE